ERLDIDERRVFGIPRFEPEAEVLVIPFCLIESTLQVAKALGALLRQRFRPLAAEVLAQVDKLEPEPPLLTGELRGGVVPRIDLLVADRIDERTAPSLFRIQECDVGPLQAQLDPSRIETEELIEERRLELAQGEPLPPLVEQRDRLAHRNLRALRIPRRIALNKLEVAQAEVDRRGGRRT